uniref:Uncharacterized protein n=1 Tax=viral metagenome TaxID=1070528 RepID=A0A6C0C306_9ZZZZ
MTDYLDMVQRKSAVDQAMDVWKERRAAEWKLRDDNWEKEYDARIAKEEREEKEREAQEKERLALMTKEEIEAEQKEFEERWSAEMEDSDSDDSDDESDYDEEELNNEWFKDYSDLSPEERKAKEWEDYKKDSKEWREKRTNEVWNAMLYCSWSQLRRYRSELGLSNENFMADTFL